MRMKKSLSIILSVFFLCLALISCGSNKNTNNETTENEENATEGLLYTLLDDGTYEVSGIGDAYGADTVIVPSTYNDKKVTKIGNDAFYYYTILHKILLPDTITEIGYGAFAYCKSLYSINLPNSITKIGNGAFFGCHSLERIVIPSSVNVIGEGLFHQPMPEFKIFCESSSQPNSWDPDWNSSFPVYWYSENEPSVDGNYWCYLDGEIAIWE